MKNPAESRPPSPLSRLSSRELCARRPDLAQREPVLWQILQAGLFLDESLRAELAAESRPLACGAGCEACCHQQAIPMTLAEGMGICAFLRLAGLPVPERTITDYLDGADRARLKTSAPSAGEGLQQKVRGHKHDEVNRCPFLRDGCCTVYPVRPLACRRFLMFGRRCAYGEDTTRTRPEDVFQPSPKKLFEALCLTLPVYERLAVSVPAKVTRQFFYDHTHVIQAFPWHVARR